MIFGLLNVNKPVGPTSHDIVAAIRRGAKEKRIGHAGTLDPLASGVLIVALGQATRLVEYLQASQKTYHAEITLGVATDSYDAEGTVTETREVPVSLKLQDIDQALNQFRGLIQQTPPVYSAIKVGGKSAHQRVRDGELVELKARSITISEVMIEAYDPPKLKLKVVCSPGTYIRSLAHDLGQALGCGAMLSGLIRTASGAFNIEQAVDWDDLQTAFADGSWNRYLLPADQALANVPVVSLSADEVRRVADGMPVPRSGASDNVGRAYTPDGKFIAVLQGNSDLQLWQPIKVFAEIITDWRTHHP